MTRPRRLTSPPLADYGYTSVAGGALTGPESALSSLPICPVYWDAEPGMRRRELLLPSCGKPARPVDGRDMRCSFGHRFAGTPREHEQARDALAAAEGSPAEVELPAGSDRA